MKKIKGLSRNIVFMSFVSIIILIIAILFLNFNLNKNVSENRILNSIEIDNSEITFNSETVLAFDKKTNGGISTNYYYKNNDIEIAFMTTEYDPNINTPDAYIKGSYKLDEFQKEGNTLTDLISHLKSNIVNGVNQNYIVKNPVFINQRDIDLDPSDSYNINFLTSSTVNDYLDLSNTKILSIQISLINLY